MAVACLAGLWILVRFISDGEGFAEVGHAMVLGLITFMRVTLLTVVCSIIWVPIGVKIGMNPRISRFVQPLVQVLASFPSNFTFPFVTLWFIAWHIDISWGSILLMSLGTQWYILFNVIAGASAIPDDLREATRAFHLDTRQRWTKLILPAVFGSRAARGTPPSSPRSWPTGTPRLRQMDWEHISPMRPRWETPARPSSGLPL